MIQTVCEATCSQSDYSIVIGGEFIAIPQLIFAANANMDHLLVAGTYDDGWFEEHSFIYLFEESTCTYLWKFLGSEELTYPKALAWSDDQSQAYMVSYKGKYVNDHEYFTVFEDPYDILRPFGTPSPKTYRLQMQNPVNYVLANSGLVGLTKNQNTNRILLTRSGSISVLSVG